MYIHIYIHTVSSYAHGIPLYACLNLKYVASNRCVFLVSK